METRGRTCVGCRRVFDRSELIRLVRRDGAAVIDESGHAPGRGAYLCRRWECFEQGRRRLGRALRGATLDEQSLRERFRTMVEESV